MVIYRRLPDALSSIWLGSHGFMDSLSSFICCLVEFVIMVLFIGIWLGTSILRPSLGLSELLNF